MTVSAAKPEEKRLGWFVPTAVDQAESCVKPAAEGRNLARMPNPQHSETERLDHWLKPKSQQTAGETHGAALCCSAAHLRARRQIARQAQDKSPRSPYSMARPKIALIGAGSNREALPKIAFDGECRYSRRYPCRAKHWTSPNPALPRGLTQRCAAPRTTPTLTGARNAGVPRKPGMSRDDLLGINLKAKSHGGHRRARCRFCHQPP